MSNMPPKGIINPEPSDPADPPYPSVDYQTTRNGSLGPFIYSGVDSAIETDGKVKARNVSIEDENGNESELPSSEEITKLRKDMEALKIELADIGVMARAATLVNEDQQLKLNNHELRLHALDGK